jgi:hypothetical protein
MTMEHQTNLTRIETSEQGEQRSMTSTFLHAVDEGAGWTVGAGLVVKGSQVVGKLAEKVKSKEKD